MRAARSAAVLAAAALTLTACGSTGPKSSPTTSAPSSTTTSSTTTSTTVPARTTATAPRQETTTTVVGPHGPASKYPAAQSLPPSLAVATPTSRSVDLVQVLVALETYRDWVWSHPDPGAVAHYEDPSGPGYHAELAFVTHLKTSHLHADPKPTVIVWARMTSTPNLINVRDGLETFQGGVVEAVFDLNAVPLLNQKGARTGQTWTPQKTGLVVYRIAFAQSATGQWRILAATIINPPGGAKRLVTG